MRRVLLFILLISFPIAVNAQRVGLVLSGGAAKGIAHIGVLKALEENDIPIDYVVGTSMGGIIAGCYAAGMSPDEIEAMILSKQFLGWVNGSPEQGYNYFYHLSDPNPGFLTLNLALDSSMSFHFNSTIANDVSLNFALAEKMAQASLISKNNFDSLFIPLRVIAADIFTQNEVILAKGSLSDALRATQTVPFFYHPIRVDGKYLFDGGVYNNFPVDVAQKHFNPDVIVGVNVSTKIFDEYPYENDDKLIGRSLLFLLLDKSDPSLIPESGVFIQPNLRGYTSFDFGSAKSLIDSGYAQTIRQIPELKAKIGRSKTCAEVNEERNNFRNRSIPFAFDKISFRGFNSKQRGYIRRVFRPNRRREEELTYGDVKRGYFRLVSEEYFQNVYPRMTFDSTRSKFRLQLTRRPQQNFQVDFGGVIATRDISNIFMGFNYYYFNRALSHAYLAFQTGNFYKSALAKVRVDLPVPFFLEPYAAFDGYNYFENDDLLSNVSTEIKPTILRRTNRKLGLNIGVPLKHSFKAVVQAEVFRNNDRYGNNSVFVSTDTLDKLKLTGFKAGVYFTTSTLNRKQYASTGRAFSLSAHYYAVDENLRPGNTSVLEERQIASHQWYRVKATAEQYIGSGRFKPGYYFEGVISNQPSFGNYLGTIINTPAFSPLQDSPTLLLQNFRSFSYVSAGLRGVLTIIPRLDWRVEGYVFKPLDYLKESINQETEIIQDFKKVFLTGTTGLVYHAPIGPVSLSLNYYDDDETRLGVLLHVGYLLFNKHSMD
jgi:NTE family protein